VILISKIAGCTRQSGRKFSTGIHNPEDSAGKNLCVFLWREQCRYFLSVAQTGQVPDCQKVGRNAGINDFCVRCVSAFFV
jgi:hypothetical protein